jgi:DNA-binding transcriptional LysR family regulator
MTQQITALKEGRIDVGFLRQPAAEPWLVEEPLVAEPFAAALPLGHHLARRSSIDPHEIGDVPLVAFPRETAPHFYDLMVHFCREAGFVPDIQHDADHPLTVLALVSTGIGVALVPACLRRVPRPGVVFRTIRGARLILTTSVAWRRESESPTLQTFVRIVRDVMPRRSSKRSA